VGFSGLIGQITNKLAIRMILDYVDIELGITRIRVPGSGLLQRNLNQLIDFVSKGSVNVLNEEVVIKELRDQKIWKKLLEDMQEQPNTLMVRIISVMLEELESCLDNDQFYFLLRNDIIKRYAREHRTLAIANLIGIIDYDDLTHTIIKTLKDTAHQLQISQETWVQLEALVKEVCEGLSLRKEKLEEELLAIVEIVLPKFDLAKAVRNRLIQFSPQKIKEKVKEGAADYLGWIEIWGGVLGVIVGLLMGTIF